MASRLLRLFQDEKNVAPFWQLLVDTGLQTKPKVGFSVELNLNLVVEQLYSMKKYDDLIKLIHKLEREAAPENFKKLKQDKVAYEAALKRVEFILNDLGMDRHNSELLMNKIKNL